MTESKFYAKNWKYDASLNWAYRSVDGWGHGWNFEVRLKDFNPETAYQQAIAVLSDTVASQAFPWTVRGHGDYLWAHGEFNLGPICLEVKQMSNGLTEFLRYHWHLECVENSIVPHFQQVIDAGIFKKPLGIEELMNLTTSDGETFVEFIKRDIAETPASSIVCTTPAQRIADMLVANGHIDLVKDERLVLCESCSFFEGECGLCAGHKKVADFKIPARL